MEFASGYGLYILAGVLIFIGVLLQNYVSRYDFMGMIFSSIWHIIRGKRNAKSPTEIEERLNEIGAAPTTYGKARRVGDNVIGYFLAPIVGLVSLIMIVVGVGIIGAAYYFG